MLIKDIDLNVIADILKELPEGLEVTSISLTKGYQVNLLASDKLINDNSGDEALKDIINYIKQNKNYLLIDD